MEILEKTMELEEMMRHDGEADSNMGAVAESTKEEQAGIPYQEISSQVKRCMHSSEELLPGIPSSLHDDIENMKSEQRGLHENFRVFRLFRTR